MESTDRMLAFLFSDLKGFSKIEYDELYTRVAEINEQIKKEILTDNNHIFCNTWGDAFFICCNNCLDVAEIALKLMDKIYSTDWKKLGFKKDLAIRIGLHAQNAQICYDENGAITDVIGPEISRTARIEPIVTDNQIFCSKVFHEILLDKKNYKFKFIPLGKKKLAKEFGEMELYQLLWSKLKLGLLFEESDNQLAYNFSSEIIKRGIEIYNDNFELFKKISNDIQNKSYFKYDMPLDDISYFIVLITDNYLKNSENIKLLKELTSKNDVNFFLIKVGKLTNSIPEFETIICENDFDDIINVDYNSIIDSFVEKINSTEEKAMSNIKPYKSIETILKLFRPYLLFERIDELLNKSNRIGYELYLATDPEMDSTRHYYLYLYAGCVLNKTYKQIIEKHHEIFKNRKLTILLSKEKNQKLPEKRKSNVTNLFKPIATYYIDEFICKFCAKDYFKELYQKLYVEKIYVDPYLKDHQNIFASNYLMQWYKKENFPILVIKGTGGIGKTTVVRYFSDTLAKTNSNFRTLFIDTCEIISQLKQNPSMDELSLYTFYLAYRQKNQSFMQHNTLNEDVFKLSIDNGNILVILDGLDEVISKIEGFNLKKFLTSIYDYSNEIGNGKVLITCRNYFWDKNDIDEHVENIELLPFDNNLAKQFFQKIFPDNEKIVKKGLRIANNLTKNSDEYSPHVLDTITFILKDESDGSELSDPSFDSELMDTTIKNDYILYRLCQREENKLGTPGVDNQIKLFIKIAIDFNSSLKSNNIIDALEDIFHQNVKEDQIKEHPILSFKDNILTFKYDFYEEHFKNIALGLLFKGKTNLDMKIIEILKTYVKFDSTFIEDCCTRIGPLDDNKITLLLDILDKISKLRVEKEKEREKAISAIFKIALKMLKKIEMLNCDNTTKIMKDLFYTNGVIKHLALEQINEFNSPQKIIFDFSNLTFSNCCFSEYDYFWNCKFNDNTFFDNCKLISLNTTNTKIEASYKNFDLKTCIIDESVERILNKKTEHMKNIREKKINELKAFLKLFYKHGNMLAEQETIMRSKYRGQFDEMLNFLKTINFVIKFETEKKAIGIQWDIADAKKNDAIKFCIQGIMTNEVKKAIDLLLE